MNFENLENGITIYPIGIVRSEYKTLKAAPAQGYISDIISEIEIFEKFADGLKLMETRDKIQVIYFGHKANRKLLKSVPPHMPTSTDFGVFVTRSPHRPNPLAICNVKIVDLDLENRILKVKGLDALDGSPVIDIKGYLEAKI